MTDNEKTHLLLLNKAVQNMQGRTFYIEDDEGVLRRWYPPMPALRNGEVK